MLLRDIVASRSGEMQTEENVPSPPWASGTLLGAQSVESVVTSAVR